MKTLKIAVLSLVMLSGYSLAESTSLNTVKEYMAAWNAHDASRAAQYLAEDAVYYDAAAGEPINGRKKQKKRLSALLLRRCQILAGKWLENPSTTKTPWHFVGSFQAKIVVNGQGVRRQIIRSNLKASAIFMLKREKSPGRVIIMILKNWMKS